MGFLSLSLLLCSSCQNEKDAAVESLAYFDMLQFMQAEIEDLIAENKTLKKIMYTSDTTETQFIEQPDWQKELEIFASSNINKPTLYGTYSVDTNEHIIQYKSLKSKNKVEALTLSYATSNLKTIKKIEISNRQENYISQSLQTLIYQPKQNYSIDIEQTVISNKSNTFKLVCEIGDGH